MRRDDRAANCSTCSPTGNDPARATVDLFWEVMQSGNTARVKAALAAGADVNGSPELPCPPIMAATAKADVDMISFLIENKVDPDRPAGQDTPCPDTDYGIVTGERALHLAAKRGNLEIVSLLLRQGGADPNAADTRGRTALMVACTFQQNCVALVWLLLKAGADPTLMEENGLMPMHLAAQNGLIDLVDMLHAGAPPAALNTCSAVGKTPLAIACIKGNESVVSRLLSLGARQQTPFDKNMICPLAAATFLGFVGVVRIL